MSVCVPCADDESARGPQSVAQGPKLQVGFLGLDSLYLVLEYPHSDVFKRWAAVVKDLNSPRLHDGIPYDDLVIRRGGLGYKLSVWDGDARVFITNRVNDELSDTAYAGHGLGMMLQLGPKWLREYGEVVAAKTLINNILAQFTHFGVEEPEQYPIRMNRADITVDVIGLDIAGFSIDQWREQWVGYATQKTFHISAQTGELEGLSIGSSEGSVRFKAYDKLAESGKRGTSRFWRSVWGVGEEDEISVTRFEWTVKCFDANFADVRYLSDFTFGRFLELLNYVSLRWGRLCIPQPNDTNQTRWPFAPLWRDLRCLIDDWTFQYDKVAKREYDFTPDLNPAYLRSIAGWLAGLQVRVGLEKQRDAPASLAQGLSLLHDEGFSISEIQRKAEKRWKVLSSLLGKGGAKDGR